jgi:glycosyltransferase involved in cell wall biosynthesis
VAGPRASVSVVIPTHDRVDLVRRAVSSVLAQSLPPTEVIVVDDGSTDGTAEELRLRFPSVRVVELGERRGVSAARNRGIEESRGEWIALLDSDDEWREAKLERQLAALAAVPGHRICHTDEIWIRRGNQVLPRRRHRKRGGRIFRDCLPQCAISPSSVLLARSLFDEVGGFDEELPVCEDYDLWLRICVRQPVLFVDEPLVVKYGGHSDQLSRCYPVMDRYRVRALEKVLASGELTGADRDAAQRMLVHKIDVVLRGARRRGRHDLVRSFEAKRARYG